jgi:D-3-phosphoglycerate dehydrogenase
MKALITATFDPAGLERLRQYMDVEYSDWRAGRRIFFNGEEFAQRILDTGADVLIVEADLVHDEVFDRCNLRLIGCCRGDPINIGVERATALGVPVLFTPARNADAVTDLAVGFMLALLRNIVTVNMLLRQGELQFQSTADYLGAYERYGGAELGGLNVGIVGLGAIGRAVAQRVHGFGSHVLAYDPHVDQAVFDRCRIESVALDDLLRRSDILTVHCPEMPTTFGLIGAREIGLMPRGSYILNLARASIVDEDALYAGLESGHLAGAALDVFREEPVQPTNRFLKLPNVLVSPHLGGATRDVVRHQSRMIVDGIEAYLRGERPAHIVNPAVLDRSGERGAPA